MAPRATSPLVLCVHVLQYEMRKCTLTSVTRGGVSQRIMCASVKWEREIRMYDLPDSY